MQTHHIGVQVGENCDPTDHSLARNAQAETQGKTEKLGTLFAHPNDKGEHHQSNDDEEKREKPVAELNYSVETHFSRCDEGILSATGPGGTSQTRAGEANGATRPDDEDLADERSPRGNAHTTIGDARQPLPQRFHGLTPSRERYKQIHWSSTHKR